MVHMRVLEGAYAGPPLTAAMLHEEACEVSIAVVGMAVICLRHSALGETGSLQERPRTRPSRLRTGGSTTAARWNDRPTAI